MGMQVVPSPAYGLGQACGLGQVGADRTGPSQQQLEHHGFLQAALEAGFEPVSLGPRVLRAETAPLAALSLLTLSGA